MSNIIIKGAREGNLQDISLEIPRDKLTVFTGLSGSGKSTLAIDVIFQECQRQYLEAMGLQGLNKPKIDFIRNLSPAIMIKQIESNKNPRSTVGTLTDIYTELRMVYEKLGVRTCPCCNEVISAAECKEEVEGGRRLQGVYDMQPLQSQDGEADQDPFLLQHAGRGLQNLSGTRKGFVH